MKQRVLFFLLIIFFGLKSGSQTIYHLSHTSPYEKDTTRYETFLMQQDNGTGYARINFTTSPGKKRITYEMPFQQEFPVTKDGTTDTSWIICRGMNPVVKKGDKRIKILSMSYWLKLNPENGQYVPQAVTLPNTNMYPGNSNLINATLVTDQSEMRSLVPEFFLAAEPFYKNLFDPKKRGGAELLTTDQKTTKLHLLIVASTDDTSIGNSAILDVSRAIKTFRAVAKALTIGENIIVDTVCGENYNRTNVLNAINGINPQKGKDIVIFYYSGHGFTNPKQPGKKFPWLDLLHPLQKPRPDPRDSSLNIEDIYTMIKRKGARLNLVISDCCNNRIGDKPIKKDPSPGVRGELDINKWNKTNVKSLFMGGQPLSLLATAATKGERAASNDKYGGFYSNNFLAALTSYFNNDKSSPLWSQVFAEAQKKTIWQATHTYCPEEKGLCHQTPPLPKVN